MADRRFTTDDVYQTRDPSLDFETFPEDMTKTIHIRKVAKGLSPKQIQNLLLKFTSTRLDDPRMATIDSRLQLFHDSLGFLIPFDLPDYSYETLFEFFAGRGMSFF
jgi:hypothetical protein